MPTLGEATEWVKSDPLGPAELRGHSAIAITASIFLDIFNVFLLLPELFGGNRD